MQPASYGDVMVRPIAQKPSLFPDHDEAARSPACRAAPIPETVHPAIGRTCSAARSADAEIRRTADAGPERDPSGTWRDRRKSIRRRPACRCCSVSANVGLGRRDEETEPPVCGASVRPRRWLRCRRCPSVSRSAASPSRWRQRARRCRNTPSRPAPQGLDSHGRPAPVAPAPQGDDHLDIPAFLRRQTN